MSTAGACVSKCTQVHEYYSSQSPKTRSLSTDRCLCSSASHMPPKRKGRAQPRLDVPKYKLLRQPMSLLGTQVKFPGSFWEGRMTAEEKAADYLCTVLDFQIAHRMQPGAPPTQAFQLQEMGTDGTGSLERSDLESTKFWCGYPTPFLDYYYKTFPEEEADAPRRAPRARPVRHLHRRPGRPGRLRRRMPPPWHREYLAAVPCIVCGSVCVF